MWWESWDNSKSKPRMCSGLRAQGSALIGLTYYLMHVIHIIMCNTPRCVKLLTMCWLLKMCDTFWWMCRPSSSCVALPHLGSVLLFVYPQCNRCHSICMTFQISLYLMILICHCVPDLDCSISLSKNNLTAILGKCNSLRPYTFCVTLQLSLYLTRCCIPYPKIHNYIVIRSGDNSTAILGEHNRIHFRAI